MTTRHPSFEPLAVPLSGMQLIEASAGSGKTHTLVSLYGRLVVEAGIEVNRILVLTFTRTATAELRNRIRKRLASALDLARGNPPCDDRDHEVRRWLDGLAGEPRAAAEHRLRRAIADFDTAAVFTLHGFCQRVLGDLAFSAGEPFEMEVIEDEPGLRAEVARDYWRREAYPASLPFARYLVERGLATPDALLGTVSSCLDKPFAEIRGGDTAVDCAPLEGRLQAVWRDAAVAFDPDGIAALLIGNPVLNGNKFRADYVATRLDRVGEIFAAEPNAGADMGPLEKFTQEYVTGGTKAGRAPPAHPFFAAATTLVAAHGALTDAYERNIQSLQRGLIGYLAVELRRRGIRRRVQGYGDMLRRLADALATPASGSELAAHLRAAYPAALIDEFQDTDPVQYDIFSRIYRDSGLPVFLVGDPKQAIYNFRGADVHAYLAARASVGDGGRHALTSNWRSEPMLIDAVNALFYAPDRPFVTDAIDFEPAVAAPRPVPPLLIGGRPEAPFRIWMLDRTEGRELSGTTATGQALAATASEVARLLNLGQRGEAIIDESQVDPTGSLRPLRSPDIAILVRTNKQAIAMQDALRRRGVAAVLRTQASVFASREAGELRRVLAAIALPGNVSHLASALATDMLGTSGEGLAALRADEAGWDEVAERFRAWHGRWRDQGIVVMLRRLFADAGVPDRLLAYVDGERRLTNLLHLAELLALEAARADPGMEGLIAWLARRRSEAAEDGSAAEDEQLRLESDENLVQILTVHKSKGLEFPVVFCPFLWHVPKRVAESRAEPPFVFHQRQAPYHAILDLAGDDAEGAARFREEELAEQLRLLYVALTRARNRCYLVWGAVNNGEESGGAWLWHRVAAGDKARWRTCDLAADLEHIAGRAHGAIEVSPAPADGELFAAAVRATPLAARVCRRRIGREWGVFSFSSLHDRIEDERPDHDRRSPYDSLAVVPSATPVADDIFSFPRGAQAGSCLHAIFEHHDFASRDPQALHALVGAQLAAHGYGGRWVEVVARMMEDVLATELIAGSDLRLSAIATDQRLNELEFHYPVAALDGPAIARLLRQHGHAAESIEDLRLAPGRGYMKGYLDLVFEWRGRYYLADYKSNWLGGERDAYRRERLDVVMDREGYTLQMLIYTLALHRWLRRRLPGYDYETHCGGAFYLFVRGMGPASGPGCGVHHDRPPAALIAALDRQISGNGGNGE